jgi:PKD repeat protein
LASAADSVTITVTNAAPIADAGADQVVLAGELVTLDGSASNDLDGHTPLSYAWTQSAGSAVTLSDPSAVSPSFTATISGIYTFELLVTDSMGLASAADSVTITVTNGEPVANAGADQVVLAGELVTLDGSASADPDGHTPLSYGWTQIAGTPVSLSDSSAIAPTFTAPNGASVLRFSLVVTDSMGLASAADTVTITVNSAAAPIYQMHLPLIQHSPAELRANLVVTALKADQDGLQLQIKNTGNAATQSAFWVDLYINPSQIPQLNTPWQDIAPAGAVWAVTQTLAPGESLLLTLDSPSFAIEYSLLKYQAGDQLYAIVDSYNANSSYGAISESNEQDNRFGPVSASASAKRVQPTNIPNNYNKLPAR